MHLFSENRYGDKKTLKGNRPEEEQKKCIIQKLQKIDKTKCGLTRECEKKRYNLI